MNADQVLAFRLARSGLADRNVSSLAEAAACPASDFNRDAAVIALAARADGVTREAYDRAVDSGKLVVAHVIRGAIHAIDPKDHALYGRALIATDDDELGKQLGQQIQRLANEHDVAPTDALDEVTAAITDALAKHDSLDKNELHEQMRSRVGKDLMPWCKGCKSHHVAPMLWRYATVNANARVDAERRYTKAKRRNKPTPSAAARRFLSFYGPATPSDFADWAGLAKPHAERLWDDIEDELTETRVGKRKAWLLTSDTDELESPPKAEGIRLLPPGDPYLQKPNRPLLAPDDDLRKRLFRPVASPGVVLHNGRLAGVWRAKAKGKQLEIAVEQLKRIPRGPLEDEAERIAQLRGADAVITLS